MNTITKTFIVVISAMLLLSIGATGGWWLQRQQTTLPASAAQPVTDKEPEKKVLYWYDPMVPQQRFDKPGKSPFMDMDLVPKYAQDPPSDEGMSMLEIDPRVVQNLGIREALVERTSLATHIDATGIIRFNEREVSIEQARLGGFVERVWPLAPGDFVTEGQALAELLIPEWTSAQHEFLAVRNIGDQALIDAARNRLHLLGMPKASIRELEHSGQARTHFTLHATRSGVIETLDVRSGMTLMAGQTLARINGLASVWLEIAVPEAQASSVRVGNQAEVRLAAQPGKTIKGSIISIFPALADTTRSLRVRLELSNNDASLRPGMSAQVRLTNHNENTALTIPTEAIIRTGKRSVVIVVDTPGKYAPVEIALGDEIGNRTAILNGLTEGQKIVASGQFLIDSEASLSGVMTRYLESNSNGDKP